MKKTFFIIFFPIVSFLIANIDVVLGWNYELLGDRFNYLKQVEDPLFNSYNSIFSYFNYEFLWFRILHIIKFVTNPDNPNFVLRVVVFLSSLIFLKAFKRRTNSYLLPLFIIFLPGVIELYIVKIRHGLALSIFAYISSFRFIKFKNFYYLIVGLIHNSFLLTIPAYLVGLGLNNLKISKLGRLFLNIFSFVGGSVFSLFILQLMKIFGIRQYFYIEEALQQLEDFSSFGIYRVAIFIIVICLLSIKLNSYDSDALMYATSFFLGVSFLSFIGGRFLTTYLPFLVAEIMISKTQNKKFIYWSIRFLIISIFIYGWIINSRQPGWGFYT